MEFSAQQIASVLGGTVEGDPEVKVNNFSKIEEGKPGTLTFLANPKYEHFIYQTEASIVLVNNDFTPAEPVKSHIGQGCQCLCFARHTVEYGGTGQCQKRRV